MTNAELLALMWVRQLYSLAIKTVTFSEPGKVSVVSTDNFYWSAKVCCCNDSLPYRRQLGKLVKAKLLTRWHVQYMQVYFDTELAKIAFHSARAFWSTKGIPDHKDANGVTQAAKKIDPATLKQWQSECHQLLINNFNYVGGQ